MNKRRNNWICTRFVCTMTVNHRVLLLLLLVAYIAIDWLCCCLTCFKEEEDEGYVFVLCDKDDWKKERGERKRKKKGIWRESSRKHCIPQFMTPLYSSSIRVALVSIMQSENCWFFFFLLIVLVSSLDWCCCRKIWFWFTAASLNLKNENDA